MPVIAEKNTRPPTPEGQYVGRCIDVYDAGWWKKMDSDTEYVRKVKIVFVLDQCDDEGRPYFIDIFETLSLNEKANLHKQLVAWRGRKFTADELKGFDVEKLIGVPALIQVVHKTKNNGEPRAVVGSIQQLPKGIAGDAVPKKPESYKLDRDRDEQFASKHPKPQPKVAAHAAAIDADDVAGSLDDDDDDLPF